MIDTGIEHLRDPFIVVTDDAYYAYGTCARFDDWNNTEWGCYKNIGNDLHGEWKKLENQIYVTPENAVRNFWAPEVHKYNGSFYMIATYFSSATNKRGCSVLKSDSPEGPFVEISNGHITPCEWDSIDGTLYVDEDGQPWMIFVHEWVSTDDKVGRMAAAKLSDDLSRFITEPIELFRADDPSWTNSKVTDGCFMHKTEDGKLLMIWSNFCDDAYCVGVAESTNGKVDGCWIHHDKLLYSKDTFGGEEGGHGMIFKDRDGKMYLAIHSPNKATETNGEKTVFIPLCEADGNLICE